MNFFDYITEAKYKYSVIIIARAIELSVFSCKQSTWKNQLLTDNSYSRENNRGHKIKNAFHTVAYTGFDGRRAYQLQYARTGPFGIQGWVHWGREESLIAPCSATGDAAVSSPWRAIAVHEIWGVEPPVFSALFIGAQYHSTEVGTLCYFAMLYAYQQRMRHANFIGLDSLSTQCWLPQFASWRCEPGAGFVSHPKSDNLIATFVADKTESREHNMKNSKECVTILSAWAWDVTNLIVL